MLREIAARLKQSVRGSDLAVRLGGDEFAIVMPCAPAEQVQLVERLHELEDAIAYPVRCGERTVTCGGSMGIAVFPHDGVTLDALMAKADAHMYAAKKKRKVRPKGEIIRPL